MFPGGVKVGSQAAGGGSGEPRPFLAWPQQPPPPPVKRAKPSDCQPHCVTRGVWDMKAGLSVTCCWACHCGGPRGVPA